jgi:hypothetical protein
VVAAVPFFSFLQIDYAISVEKFREIAIMILIMDLGGIGKSRKVICVTFV